MVTLKTFIAAVLFFALPAIAWAESSVPVFKMEFSKPEVYVGQQVVCNFIVYTPEELIEVEVAKFPEFRGFWKENLVLRQGPISTTYGVRLQQPNSAVVGSYVLTPMLDHNNPVIEPMKIVVRNPSTRRIEGSSPPEFVLSQGDALKILPLPPVPKDIEKDFRGAVGKFVFFALEPVVNFQKDEPTLIRYTLQGQGNFQEINDLALNFPASVEVISRHAYAQGNGQFASKVFEITVAVHGSEDVILDPAQFYYFDPEIKHYQKITSPPIQLRHTASTDPAPQVVTVQFEPLRTRWSAKKDPPFTLVFLLAQLIALGALGAYAFRPIQRRLRRRAVKKLDPKIRTRKLAEVSNALAANDIPRFLRLADALAYELLLNRLNYDEKEISRAQLQDAVEKKLGKEIWQSAATIFSTYEQFAYTPSHPVPSDLDQLMNELIQLNRK